MKSLTFLSVIFFMFMVKHVYAVQITTLFKDLSAEAQRQVVCLADNIYFEAANESPMGKMAVAFVTLNRVTTGNYSNTICGVVHQKIRGVCQFSWYCDPINVKKRLTVRSTPLYNDILDIAVFIAVNYRYIDDVSKNATHFHSIKIDPQWRLQKTNTIGQHIFYRNRFEKINRERFSLV